MRAIKPVPGVCQTSCYRYLPRCLLTASTDGPALSTALRSCSSLTPKCLVQY
jgi:hypothetical protein